MTDDFYFLLDQLPNTSESVDIIMKVILNLKSQIRMLTSNQKSIKWMESTHRVLADNTEIIRTRKAIIRNKIDRCNLRIHQIKNKL